MLVFGAAVRTEHGIYVLVLGFVSLQGLIATQKVCMGFA